MSTQTVLPTKDNYNGDPTTITVGMGVTLHTAAGGLRSPFSVIEVRRNGRELVIQRDKTVHTGPNDFADYGTREYFPNPDGQRETVTLRKDGTFIVKGVEYKWYSTRYAVGHRDDWTDYSQ